MLYFLKVLLALFLLVSSFQTNASEEVEDKKDIDSEITNSRLDQNLRSLFRPNSILAAVLCLNPLVQRDQSYHQVPSVSEALKLREIFLVSID